ncbi:MAG TPA: substrate-binding domain-containing protein, partial [Tepidisphaeraceae bacterium]|nr:substrate-binding domain-containing protein [Tepidisphaeraceae bacterium]
FEAFRAQVRELLTKPDRPTGIICHSERMVGVVLAVAQDAGLSIPDDLELVFQGQVANSDERRFARVEPKMNFGKIAEIVADMLRRLSEGKPLEQQTVVIPVELRTASNAGTAE